jgi:iron complex transport system ATP-binding protein
MSALIQMHDVSFRTLIQNVSFSVHAGQVWSILGPNGAGKSTLMKLAMQILKPTSGNISGASNSSRTLAWVPQVIEEDLEFSALELVLFGRSPHLSAWAIPSHGDFAKARAALEEVGLGALENRNVSTLSGGERRRVFLARALVQEPTCLVLDEPTAFLDFNHQARLVNTVQSRVARGLAVLAVFHDLNVAAQVSSHIMLLKAGRVLAQGPAPETLTSENLSALYETPMQQGFGWMPGVVP